MASSLKPKFPAKKTSATIFFEIFIFIPELPEKKMPCFSFLPCYVFVPLLLLWEGTERAHVFFGKLSEQK